MGSAGGALSPNLCSARLRCVTTGAGRGSRSSRVRGGMTASHAKLKATFSNEYRLSNYVRVVHCQEEQDNDESEEHNYDLPEKYLKLFSFTLYPHIAKKFFLFLDAVSLMRCKLVCKDWRQNIVTFIEENPRWKKLMLQRWQQSQCSFYPITPTMYGGEDAIRVNNENADALYRNVLTVKCDESEIMLAVDNGNVEIYDRRTLKLKCILMGQFKSSPSQVDFNQKLILVCYTCGFGRPGRKFASVWNIFDRKTKKLLHSVERDGDSDVR